MRKYISVDMVKVMLHYASNIGLDAAGICRAAGFDPATHEAVSPYHYEKFWAEMIRQTQDDYFGLHYGQAMYQLSGGHFLFTIMMNAPNIGEALRKLIRYHGLMTDMAGIKLLEQGEEALIRTVFAGQMSADIQQHQADSICSMFVAGFSRLAGAADQITASQLMHDTPQDVTEYRRVLGFTPLFEQPHNQIHLKREMLSRPVLLANPDLLHQLEAFAQRQLEQMGQADTFSWAVAEAINTALHRGERPDLVSIADQLAISPRHLQRKLSEEGTAFREVFNRVQLDIAQTYLQQPEVSICEIAFLLGFSEQSAFNHAFKRWTGLTPGEYRQQG